MENFDGVRLQAGGRKGESACPISWHFGPLYAVGREEQSVVFVRDGRIESS